MRPAILIPCLVVAALTAAASARSEESQAPAALHRGVFEREVLLTGELESVRSISVKSPETSIFQLRIQFMAEEGSVVAAGEPLLTFDDAALAARVRDLETQILDARTQLVARQSQIASQLEDLKIELAEKKFNFDRNALLANVDPEVLSRKVHAERQTAREKAERELAETRERIRFTQERGRADIDVLAIARDKLEKDLLIAQQERGRLTISAPSTGLVVYERRQENNQRFQTGDSCWPGQGIIRLPDLSEMQVNFAVHEVDAPSLAVGMPVRIALDAFPGRELGGVIVQIPSMATKKGEESKIAIFKVIASLSETWASEMKPGMSVLGRVTLARIEAAPVVRRADVTCEGLACHLRAQDDPDAEPATFIPVDRNPTLYLLSEEDFGRLRSAEQEGAS